MRQIASSKVYFYKFTHLKGQYHELMPQVLCKIRNTLAPLTVRCANFHFFNIHDFLALLGISIEADAAGISIPTSAI
jgi:hypothetical protein